MECNAAKNGSKQVFDGPRALEEAEYDSAISLLDCCLHPGGPSSILQEYPLVLGKQNLQNMRVIVHEGRVVSHAAIYFSKLRSRNLTLRVGGIGSVATDPQFRGRGLAGLVIEDCLRVVREAKCHLAVLWTQRHSFYRRFGFESAGSEYLFRFDGRACLPYRRACEVVPFSSVHLPGIITIHEKEPFRTERSRVEYETYFSLPKTKILVALREASVTAYAVLGKGEDFRNCVHDWGGDPNDLLCLLRHMLSAADSREVLILTPSEDNALLKTFRQMAMPTIFEYLAMMKVVDLEGLLAALNRRLCARGLPLDISVNGQEVIVRAGNERARLPRITLLERLLFGPDQPSRLLEEASSKMLGRLEEILPVPLFIWGLDSV